MSYEEIGHIVMSGHMTALRWIDSTLYISPSVWGVQTVETYSSCGLTSVL